MILTLEAAGPEGAMLGQGRRHEFSTEGGVIGRARSSDWVLAHTKVSGRHAVITYQDGVFYIEDTSTNGVFMNTPKNRLVQGRRYALQSGDRILIDPYVIEVEVSDEQPSRGVRVEDSRDRRTPDRGALDADPFSVEDPFGPSPAPPRQQARRTPRPDDPEPEPVPSEEVDPLKLLGADPQRTPQKQQVRTVQDLDQSPVAGHYSPPPVSRPTPPAAAPPPIVIPEDYDPLSDDFIGPPTPTPQPIVPEPVALPPLATNRSPRPTPIPEPPESPEFAPPGPPPVEPPRPTPRPEPVSPSSSADRAQTASVPVGLDPVSGTPSADAGDIVDLLAGAGLTHLAPTPDLARRFGQIFRVVVEGVMEILGSRREIRDEFRIPVTRFRVAENNPLKMSVNVDDALHNLLVKRNPAYLGPVDAFQDAFDDLRNHELAMLQGMRAAFEAMIAQLEPDRLEKQFDRQLKRVPFLGAIARYRYWDLYRDLREEMAKDPDARFKKLFGEQFARAYEEQLNRLKAESRARRAGAQPKA